VVATPSDGEKKHHSNELVSCVTIVTFRIEPSLDVDLRRNRAVDPELKFQAPAPGNQNCLGSSSTALRRSHKLTRSISYGMYCNVTKENDTSYTRDA